MIDIQLAVAATDPQVNPFTVQLIYRGGGGKFKDVGIDGREQFDNIGIEGQEKYEDVGAWGKIS